MVFCSSCGRELPEDACFCPRCGVRTRRGIEVGVGGSWDEVREAFSEMGEELERAFVTAGREIERAFKTVREEVREATAGKELVVCPDCGEEIRGDAKFCYKCGKKLD